VAVAPDRELLTPGDVTMASATGNPFTIRVADPGARFEFAEIPEIVFVNGLGGRCG
jgi:hypothetical protein